MTDLEMTRLCAEAIGLLVQHCTGENVWRFPESMLAYDPLHDDAQAMALVKKFHLSTTCITPVDNWDAHKWYVSPADDPMDPYKVICQNLNRAIVECVAKMQQAKT